MSDPFIKKSKLRPKGVWMTSIWRQKTNLFWVGKARELCFNYSPRRRRRWFTTPPPPTSTTLWVILGWFKASAAITIKVRVSNILWLLVNVRKGIQLLKSLSVSLLYYDVDNAWERCTPKYLAEAISACLH